MFSSQRNSTLMPRMHEHSMNNYSQSVLSNSEEFSQSQHPVYMNNSMNNSMMAHDQPMNDYWAAASQHSIVNHPISSRQDIGYTRRAPLFTAGSVNGSIGGGRRGAGSFDRKVVVPTSRHATVDKFRGVVQDKMDINGKEVLENFGAVLRECTDNVKTYLEEMKGSLSDTSELKTQMDQVVSKVTSTEELMEKFEESIAGCITKEMKSAHSQDDLQAIISRKEAEMAAKDEKISHMKREIEELTAAREMATKKENTYLKEQKEKMKKVLTTCTTSADSLQNIFTKEVEHEAIMGQLLQQNKQIMQELSAVTSWQKATNHSINSVKTSLSSFTASNNTTNGVEQSSTRQHRPVSLPTSNPGSAHPSPLLPRGTRWFDVNGKPSPSAFVAPVVKPTVDAKPRNSAPLTMQPSQQQKQLLCQQPRQQQQQQQPLNVKVVPTFDETDSDSGDDWSSIVADLATKSSVKRERKKLSHHNNNSLLEVRPAARNNIKATPARMQGPVTRSINNSTPSTTRVMANRTDSVKVTKPLHSAERNVQQSTDVSESGSPFQRSIRRYGRIKKSTPVSPLVASGCVKGGGDGGGGGGYSSHVSKKKLMTIEDHWDSAVSCK